MLSRRESADDILDTAKRVIELLEEAAEAQDVAEDAIETANYDIADAEDDLESVRLKKKQANKTEKKSNKMEKKNRTNFCPPLFSSRKQQNTQNVWDLVLERVVLKGLTRNWCVVLKQWVVLVSDWDKDGSSDGSVEQNAGQSDESAGATGRT